MSRIVECVPNFSEGHHKEVCISAIFAKNVVITSIVCILSALISVAAHCHWRPIAMPAMATVKCVDIDQIYVVHRLDFKGTFACLNLKEKKCTSPIRHFGEE